MPIEAVEPRRLYRQVADQLRALMDSGEFAVGSRLPTERELASSLGISRPTVREALIALEVDGRVRIRVGSGIYVLAAPQAQADGAQPIAGPFDILAARALIEGAIVADIAGRVTAADIARMDEAIAAMQSARGVGADMQKADRDFHVVLARITGNDALTKIVGDLFDQRLHPYFAQLASYFEDSDSWRAACDEHQAVRDAIARGDGAAAQAAMQLHLNNSKSRFSQQFKLQGRRDQDPSSAGQKPLRMAVTAR